MYTLSLPKVRLGIVDKDDFEDDELSGDWVLHICKVSCLDNDCFLDNDTFPAFSKFKNDFLISTAVRVADLCRKVTVPSVIGCSSTVLYKTGKLSLTDFACTFVGTGLFCPCLVSNSCLFGGLWEMVTFFTDDTAFLIGVCCVLWAFGTDTILPTLAAEAFLARMRIVLCFLGGFLHCCLGDTSFKTLLEVFTASTKFVRILFCWTSRRIVSLFLSGGRGFNTLAADTVFLMDGVFAELLVFVREVFVLVSSPGFVKLWYR